MATEKTADWKNAPERKLYQLATELFWLYEKWGIRGAIRANSLASLYMTVFKKPLTLRDYGVKKVQQLPQKLPVFDIRGNDLILSKRKLLEFLVTPALWNGTVEERLFHQRFEEVTGVKVDRMYEIFGERNFQRLASSLSRGEDSKFTVEIEGTTTWLAVKGAPSRETPPLENPQPRPSPRPPLLQATVASPSPGPPVGGVTFTPSSSRPALWPQPRQAWPVQVTSSCHQAAVPRGNMTDWPKLEEAVHISAPRPPKMPRMQPFPSLPPPSHPLPPPHLGVPLPPPAHAPRPVSDGSINSTTAPGHTSQPLPSFLSLESQLPAQSKPETFPNPDALHEVLLPSHSQYNPHMSPASISPSTTTASFTGKKGRSLSKSEAVKKIDTTLDSIIDDLASTRKFVPEGTVKQFLEKLLYQSRQSGYIIPMREIKAWEEYNKTHSRIAELIKIFCWMSPITTLHELERALVSVESISQFEDLRMGPLIKHPLVAKFFQPPSDLQEIPQITAYQIQKTLSKFLDKMRGVERRTGHRHSQEDFLEFFTKAESKPSPLHLCVRITSFALAIQTNFRFRRMQRESRVRVEQQIEGEVKTILEHETERLRRKLTTFIKDPLSIQKHVAAKDPIVLLADIFGIFEKYLSGYQDAKIAGFLQLLMKQQWLRQMFLLAIYEGAYGAERLIDEMREENRDIPHAGRRQEEILHKTHGEVLTVLLRQLNLLPFPTDLPSLAGVEAEVAEHFGAPAFHLLTNTPFLHFLTSNRRCHQALGGSLTIGASPTSDDFKRQVTAVVSQLRHDQREDQNAVAETLKLHFGVTSVSELCCGSIDKLINDTAVSERQQQMGSAVRGVVSLIPLIVNGARDRDAYEQWSCPRVGVLGHRTAEDALSCLQRAPLLEDLSSWSHWDLVFRPQLGNLRKFLEKEGAGGSVHALEVAPGRLLRVDPQGSHQKFIQAVEARDPVNTAGQLVSIIVMQGSVHEISIQLLASHVKTALEKMASVPPRSALTGEAVDTTAHLSQFIFECLIRVPYKICHFTAKEIFIEPLRRVLNSAAVDGLLDQSRTREERRFLQSLGLGIGVKAWADDITRMVQEGGGEIAWRFVREPADMDTVAEVHQSGKPTLESDTPTGIPPPSPSPPLPSEDPPPQETAAPAPPTLSEEALASRDTDCKAIVESIRSEEFGIGLHLDGRQKEIAERQRLREGRGLQRLSKELYSKDTHFVLELIQNGDDNRYHPSLLSETSEEVPALKFVVEASCVSVLNNEVGFSEKNVRAICDVGKSTKGAHRSGYIGQKGIGFKSVFRVTDVPEIHSNGFHIKFDAQSDAIGYILPHWIEEGDREAACVGKGWTTTIILPLKEDQRSVNMARKFRDIQPSLLLFLHRLRSITVEDQTSGSARYMRRSDMSGGITRIEHDSGQDTWLVVRKELTNATQFKPDVEATEIALAFPLPPDMKTVPLAKDLEHQQVFAYLPLRSYGFRFIVQGDFDLPSSREDVNSDSAWNQWLRSEIPQLFMLVLERMKCLPNLSPTDAVALFLQFVPLDGELHDFFKPVSTQILTLLRGTGCLPTQPGTDLTSDPFSLVQCPPQDEVDDTNLPVLWKQPSQLLMVRDNFILKHLPQTLLNSTLHLFYLSPALGSAVNSSLQAQLGIGSLSIEHLIVIAEAVQKSYSNRSQSVAMPSDDSESSLSYESSMEESEEEEEGGRSQGRTRVSSARGGASTDHSVFVQWVARWLVCVHLVLEAERDRSPPTINKLKKIGVLPLTNGSLVSAQDCTLFFPPDGDTVSPVVDFKALFDEITVVDPLLFEARDGGDVEMVRPAHRIHSVLELIGVREMLPAEIIKHHILPCFQTEQWKTKPQSLLCTYLVYIKENVELRGSGVSEAEVVSLLKDCIAVVTKKHGARQPSKEVVHFSSQFQPADDLEKMFPDAKWMLVCPDYLKNVKSREGILSWRSFLQKLGVHSRGIAVEKFTEHVDKDSGHWKELHEFVGRSPDDAYTLRDYRSSEFEEIVRSVKSSRRSQQHQQEQMKSLATLLDRLWDEEYRKYAFARCYDGSNENHLGGENIVPSSFHRALKELAWLPALPPTDGQPHGNRSIFLKGRDLFDRTKAVGHLLDCHVPYIGVELKNPKLLEILQVKCRIDADEMIQFLLKWSQESSKSNAPFCASVAHMREVYLFLYRQILQGSVEEQSITDCFSNNVIFVPDVYDGNRAPSIPTAGQFYSIHNVCWLDQSTVLYAKQKFGHNLPPELPKVLQLHYEDSDDRRHQELKSAFMYFGIRETPTSAAYISCLKFVSSLSPFPEKHHINDFSSISLHISQLCMAGSIPPDFVQLQLKGCKVFPSHRNQWVSLESCVLENDSPQLEKYFGECDDIHFLQWPARLQKRQQRHFRNEELQRKEERRHFIDILGIPRLSEVVETDVQPGSEVRPLLQLRKKLHSMVPLIQRYLVATEPDLYRSLQQQNMRGKLASMFIASVLGLERRYSVRYRGEIYTSPTLSYPSCEFKGADSEGAPASLYVVASKVDNHKCLVPVLLKMFTNQFSADDSQFENLVKDLLLTSEDEMEDILTESKYQFAEVPDSEKWVIPLPDEPEHISEEDSTSSESEEEESVSADQQMEGREREPAGSKCWPPRAPARVESSSQHPPRPPPEGSSKADVVGDEEVRKIAEKHLQGEPGEMKSQQSYPPSQKPLHQPVSHGTLVQPHLGEHPFPPPPRPPPHPPTAAPSSPLDAFQHQSSHPDNTPGERKAYNCDNEPVQHPVQPSEPSSFDSPPPPNQDTAAMTPKKYDTMWRAARTPEKLLNEGSADMVSEMMTISVDAPLIPSLEEHDKESLQRVGKWGEEYVYKYLQFTQQLPDGRLIENITWVNEDLESGRPYDIEVQVDSETVYIEVKCTASADKELVAVSWKELKLAEQQKQNFHLYRVYGAGSKALALRWMQNLGSMLEMKPVRLFLEL